MIRLLIYIIHKSKQNNNDSVLINPVDGIALIDCSF